MADVWVWNGASDSSATRGLKNASSRSSHLYVRAVVFQVESLDQQYPLYVGLARNIDIPAPPSLRDLETLGVRQSTFNKPSRTP